MIIKDDTPELGAIVSPYPQVPPVREILNIEELKGQLIVFEGPDGAGKSTYIESLLNEMEKNNIKATKVHFISSEFIKHILLKSKYQNCDPYTATFIYGAALNNMLNRVIIPKLREGTTVILDRYFYSIIARGIARGCDKRWLTSLFSYLPKPNKIILLDTPISVCLNRKIEAGKMLSYWECGADIHSEDSVRYTQSVEELCKGFLLHQSNVQDVIKEITMKENTLLIDGSSKNYYSNMQMVFEFCS